MKRIIISVLIIAGIAVSAFAQGEYIRGLSNPARRTAEMGAYTFIVNVDVSSTDWTVPDSIIICGICIDDSGSVKMDLKECTGVTKVAPDYYCYPLNVTKVYKTGTDSGLRSGYITVFGFKKN